MIIDIKIYVEEAVSIKRRLKLFFNFIKKNNF